MADLHYGSRINMRLFKSFSPKHARQTLLPTFYLCGAVLTSSTTNIYKHKSFASHLSNYFVNVTHMRFVDIFSVKPLKYLDSYTLYTAGSSGEKQKQGKISNNMGM